MLNNNLQFIISIKRISSLFKVLLFVGIWFVSLAAFNNINAKPFDQDTSIIVVKKITYEGLKVTKPKIIDVEIELEINKPYQQQELDSLLKAQCIKLYNLQLFHWVKSELTDSKDEVIFKFQERWYFWPTPIFSLADRNISSWLKNMDFNRIDYGLHPAHYNFLGRNQRLTANLQEGFNKKYEIFYNIPYLNKAKNLGVNFAASTYRSRYLDFQLQDGKPITASLIDQFAIVNNYVKFGAQYRKDVEVQTLTSLTYNTILISDSLHNINSQLFHNRGNETNRYLRFNVTQTVNRRNTFSYPKEGCYVQLQYNAALGLEKTNRSPGIHEFSFESSYYKPFHKRWYYAGGAYASIKFGPSQNLLDYRQLGYKKYNRGFEFYTIPGNQAISQKNNVMYELIPQKDLKIPFIKWKKFNTVPISIYTGAHFDWGHVTDSIGFQQNLIANRLLAGGGLGIHIVTYYDRVLVLEYTFNNFGERGFFISTKFPI